MQLRTVSLSITVCIAPKIPTYHSESELIQSQLEVCPNTMFSGRKSTGAGVLW